MHRCFVEVAVPRSCVLGRFAVLQVGGTVESQNFCMPAFANTCLNAMTAVGICRCTNQTFLKHILLVL